MNVIETKLSGVLLIETKVYGDHRGYFTEAYNYDTFLNHGINDVFLQDNQSFSALPGTIRGLHYQLPPKAQTKLVRVLTGAIYDVVVDIRQKSPTYGGWLGAILSADNHRQLLVPKGFAHGFCTISPNTTVFYKVDNYYSPDHERGILWCDPQLDIKWPVTSPILSKKDQESATLADSESFIE